MHNRLFYVWHESQVGESSLQLMVIRARSMGEAINKFMKVNGQDYCEHLLTLQVKACDNIYID